MCRLNLLFVCTGNQCRSPMAAALMSRAMAERGCPAEVGSAGFMTEGAPAPQGTLRAMSAAGLDLSGHRSRLVDARLLQRAQLVATMTRQQLIDLVTVAPDAWSRCFTLREVVSRGEGAGPKKAGESIESWVARAGTGRSRTGLLGLSVADDIDDPMGRRQREFDRVRDEIATLVSRLADLLCPEATGVKVKPPLT